MKRSTFVKWSVPIVSINSAIGIGTGLYAKEIMDIKLYDMQTILSTVIVVIGTTTLQNHLGEENSKYITTAIFASLGFMYLLRFLGGSKYYIFIHLLNLLWVIVNYYRLKRH